MTQKILIVDNNKLILRLMRHLLENATDCTIQTAEDGLTALHILDSFKPELIFVDLIMPKIAGDKLCRIIRKMPEFDKTFIVILSAVAAETEIKFRSFGADACIAKGPAKEMEKHVRTILSHIETKNRKEALGGILGVDEIHHREITKELLASKKHFEITLENMADGFLELTMDGTVIYANDAATKLLATPEENLLSSCFFDYLEEKQPSILVSLLNNCHEIIEIGEDEPFTIGGKHILLKAVPLLEQEEKSIIVFLCDISQRKQAEENLQQHMIDLEDIVAQRTVEYEEVNETLEHEIGERRKIQDELESVARQWSKTFDTIQDFVSLHDNDMKLVRVNKSMADFFGKKPEELVGKYCYEVMHGSKEPWPDCPHVQANQVKKTRSTEVYDTHIGVPLLITCTPSFDDEGHMTGTVHVARDISEQKEAELEKIELITQLQDALSRVKQLSGFLPICASCKKIRDDKGYWNQIEEYIRSHSEAEFSHGLCPECACKLYPEFYAKKKK
ncbi:MAG: PAS domain S-box protein [Desulfobulbaceae bacterium]|nr:PAS domain S-box protein [Desulfobulbaceae bacterium]